MADPVVEVPTVNGSVRSDELGVTLMHEHIFIFSPELELNYPDGWVEDAEIAAAVRRLNAAKERGVDTIVDLTVLGLGRNLEHRGPRFMSGVASIPHPLGRG